MLRNLSLLLIILLQQIGISGSWTIQPPEISYSSSNEVEEVFIEELFSMPTLEKEEAISISSKSYLVIDKETAEVLIEKKSQEIVPMASLTKVMTALIVLEKGELSEEVVVSKNAVSSYGMGIGLRPNEHFTTEDLLYAALLNSSNDASVALAEHISGTEEAFVVLMNQKAKDMGLDNTTFKNSSGLDADGHVSSASDMLNIARVALENTTFSKIVSTKDYVITSKEGINHYLTNSNRLIKDTFDKTFNVGGVKTGFTDDAGECLITLAHKEGREVLSVVLGSQRRFTDSASLIEWSFRNYTW